MLRTTIYMKKSIFTRIGHAADRLGTSRRAIIVMLLERIRHDIDQFQGDFTLVKYQPRDPRKEWHRFTIVYKKQENELVSDFRRLGKLSVSYFIAKATERYLNEILMEGGSVHNYVELDHYAIGKSIVNDIICWEFYWGPPPPPRKDRITTTIHRLLNTVYTSRI